MNWFITVLRFVRRVKREVAVYLLRCVFFGKNNCLSRVHPATAPGQELGKAASQLRPQQGQSKHRKKNRQQPSRCAQNTLAALREDVETSVNKFDMHPIDQQGSFSQLDQ